MSLLSELLKRKDKLKRTETLVTCIDGRQYVESGEDKRVVNVNCYGYVVDTKPDDIPVLITDKVYIGSQDCAADEILLNFNIQHVLSLGVNVNVSVDNKFVDILDLPETNICDFLNECLEYVREAVIGNENILIHCNAGVSRTATIAIAYLMQYHEMEYEEAFTLVKSRRASIKPNLGFKNQLMKLKPGEII
ncbi:dual specificity protein phosphatase 19-like [Leptidea sinapis]|uniref:dual specificity protein phosphatase 19-like n=1 Tax=Leptidea sinapis TaxID=189913 RepID=UPI00212207E3|nr:dual specificity protein phosphatase 19-like [Leptidea sinapis]